MIQELETQVNASYVCSQCGGILTDTEKGTMFCETCNINYNSDIIIKEQAYLVELPTHELLPHSLVEEFHMDISMLSDAKLDSTYVRASSAVRDFEQKKSATQNLLNSYKIWVMDIKEAEKEVFKERGKCAVKVYQLSNLIINNFFGRYKSSAVIDEYRRISDVKVFLPNVDINTLTENIDISEIPDAFDVIDDALDNVDWGTVENSVGTLLDSKDKHSRGNAKGDLAIEGVMLGVDLLVSGLEAVGKNMGAISQVREADSDLENKINEIIVEGTNLKEKQIAINKQNRALDYTNKLLNYCSDELISSMQYYNNELVVRDYHKTRRKLDFQDKRLEIEAKIINQEAFIPFWKSLKGILSGNLFKVVWDAKVKASEYKDNYKNILVELDEKYPNSVEDIIQYQEEYHRKSKPIEEDFIKQVKQTNSYSELKDRMKNFVSVLSKTRRGLQFNN